jgi:hypothetical protein
MFSVGVGDQGAFDLGASGPVASDAGGQGEESLSGAGEDSDRGPAAVLFEAELALEGVEDRLDSLPDMGDFPVPKRFVRAVRPDRMNLEPFS